MSGINLLRKSQAVALGLALAAGAGGYAIARVTPSVSAAGHVRASLKVADPNEGPSKMGFAPIVKQVLPNVVLWKALRPRSGGSKATPRAKSRLRSDCQP